MAQLSYILLFIQGVLERAVTIVPVPPFSLGRRCLESSRLDISSKALFCSKPHAAFHVLGLTWAAGGQFDVSSKAPFSIFLQNAFRPI